MNGPAAASAPAPRDRVRVPGPPDPRDLDGDFGHRSNVEIRFADTDAMGHVNNAVYLTFVETARVAWWTATTGEPLERVDGRIQGLILAEAEVAFRSPLFFGETVVVETRAGPFGRTSLAVEHRLTASAAGGPVRLVAICRTVIVRYDYVAEAPVAWPPDIIARVEAFEGRPLRA